MIIRLFIPCLLLMPFGNCISQIPDSYPIVDESDLPNASFGNGKIYTGSSLFGYIDGGAELYLEYGFTGAWVNEISFPKGKYTIEIYRMNGPEQAFGIYSVSRFQCKSTPPLSPFTCYTKYQLQICSGPFYINIINSTGSKTDSITSLKIGEAIVKKIKEPTCNIGAYLPDIHAEILNREAILVKGPLGIMNGAPDLGDFFGNASDYTAVIFKDTLQTILSIRFSDKEKRNAFILHHDWNPEQLSKGSVIKDEEGTITINGDNCLLITME